MRFVAACGRRSRLFRNDGYGAMQRASFRLLIAVALATSQLSAARAADDSPEPPADVDVGFELTPSDRDDITMVLLQRYPILSASPGIKFGRKFQHRDRGSREWAQIVFYPHSETHGVKNAIQARCERDTPESTWSCPNVGLRRYVKLDSQDFEVRVVGNIDLDGVLALRDATKTLAATAFPNVAIDMVTMIYETEEGYLVAWGSSTWREGVTVQATLRAGGNAAFASDWDAFLLDENGERAE
jgi:hypothetical protein